MWAVKASPDTPRMTDTKSSQMPDMAKNNNIGAKMQPMIQMA